MRIIALTLSLCAIAGCKSSKSDEAKGDEAARGKVVVDRELKFEAWFPGQPNDDKTPDGKRYMLTDTKSQMVYLVQATAFAKAVPLEDTATIDLFFVGAKAGLLLGPNKGGKKTVEEKYQFDGKYPAWKVDVSLPKERIYRVRLIHRGSHFYQLIAAGPKSFVDSPDVTMFLDSLKFTD